MRHATLPLLLSFLFLPLTLASPNNPFSPFLNPLLETLFGSNNSTTPAHEELKRQYNANACPSGYNSCASLGAPGLCCRNNAVCSPDLAGHVACCPTGAVCTGTIGAVPSTAGGVGVAGAGTSTVTSSTSNNGGLVFAGTSTTTATSSASSSQSNGGGFIVAASSTVAYIQGTGAGSLRSIPFPVRLVQWCLRLFGR